MEATRELPHAGDRALPGEVELLQGTLPFPLGQEGRGAQSDRDRDPAWVRAALMACGDRAAACDKVAAPSVGCAEQSAHRVSQESSGQPPAGRQPALELRGEDLTDLHISGQPAGGGDLQAEQAWGT